MQKFKTFLAMIVGALLTILVVQNTDVVSLKFLVWEYSMSRIVLLPLVALFGFIIGFIVGKK